jgi:hypothetical protein
VNLMKTSHSQSGTSGLDCRVDVSEERLSRSHSGQPSHVQGRLTTTTVTLYLNSANRNASINFLTLTAPSVWLELGFRRKRTRPVRFGNCRRDRRVKHEIGFGIRFCSETSLPSRSILGGAPGEHLRQALQETHGADRKALLAPPFLETRGRYRRNGDFRQSGNHRKPGQAPEKT